MWAFGCNLSCNVNKASKQNKDEQSKEEIRYEVDEITLEILNFENMAVAALKSTFKKIIILLFLTHFHFALKILKDSTCRSSIYPQITHGL